MKRIKKVILLMLVCSSMLLNAFPQRPFGSIKGKSISGSKTLYKNNSLSDLKVELQLYHNDENGEYFIFRADNRSEYNVYIGGYNTRNFTSFVIKEPNGSDYSYPKYLYGYYLYSKGMTCFDSTPVFLSDFKQDGDYELQWFVYETYDCQGEPLWKSNKLILNFTKENEITVVADEYPENWDEEKIANHFWGYLDLPKHIKLSQKVQEQFEKYKPKILELDAREKKRVEDERSAQRRESRIFIDEEYKKYDEEANRLYLEELAEKDRKKAEVEKLEKKKSNKLFWQRFSIITIIFTILIIFVTVIFRRKKLCKISSNN